MLKVSRKTKNKRKVARVSVGNLRFQTHIYIYCKYLIKLKLIEQYNNTKIHK